MAKENIVLPAMSDQMTDAELLSWKVTAGDKVTKGDILCEISTDKVDMDLDSPFTGEILSLKAEEGDVINVGEQENDSVLRKALAIGADRAFRINEKASDSFQVAKLIANHIEGAQYDLIIAGRESIDYNGCMVPGMISELLNVSFITNCVRLEINGQNVVADREIEGGIETLSCKLPIIIGGQKGLVEESDLKIPNMRGIMQSRQKPLEVIEPSEMQTKTTTNKFYKPEEKSEIKMVDSNDLDTLIDLLHNEAKVI